MALSPPHRFGQIIGDILEEITLSLLQDFCDQRGLYLDKKGVRDTRKGKKVSWEDMYGNIHDLDFVIEKDATATRRGRPVAFIEAAWRRYTKHSRNKSQEIQGAILPIADKHHHDKPFLGAVLAGVFTAGSLTQLRSSGFEVVLFPYETIVESFAHVGIQAAFDEDTPDATFQTAVDEIEALSSENRSAVRNKLVELNQPVIDAFAASLAASLDRRLTRIIMIPLHGQKHEFETVQEAITFINGYDEAEIADGEFIRYEIIARYSNSDTIDASFDNKERAIRFLNYISTE